MNDTCYLTHAHLVLDDQVVNDGALSIEAGRIRKVCPGATPAGAREIHLQGAMLAPGIIDLHSDAVESLAEPRPGVYFPFDHAAAQIDRLAAACGITTFFNAVSFAGKELGLRNHQAGRELVEALHAHRPRALIDLRVHCRFEVTCETGLPDLLDFIKHSMCHLVSYMDHSPGQGQFRDESAYRDYMTSRYGYSDEEVDRLVTEKSRDADAIGDDVRALADAALAAGIPLAGHDADTPEHVQQMAQLGAVLAEFPMNRAAARAGVEAGLHLSVGATNVLRGGSQRSGMSATEVIEQGLADCLCSDYLPSAMLPAAFKLSNEIDMPLHEAMKLISKHPAAAAGLADRGRIAEGLRADLIAIRLVNRQPHVECTWREGEPVLACRSGYLRDLTSS